MLAFRHKKARSRGSGLFMPLGGLEHLYVFGLPALLALGDLELHRLSLLQGAEAAGLNGGEMHKDILAVLAADETKPLGVVKPLHCSLFHCFVPLRFWICLEDAAVTERWVTQK